MAVAHKKRLRHRKFWHKGKGINQKVQLFILSDAFYYAGIDVPYAFMAVLITSQISDGNVGAVGFSLTLSLLARAFSELPFSAYTRKLHFNTKGKIVAGSLIVYGLLLILTGQSTLLWQVYTLQILIGVLEGLAYPLKWGIFTKIIDDGNEEFEWGLEDVASTFFPAVFASIAGLLAAVVGLPILFIVFGGVMITSGIIFLLIYKSD